MSKLIVDLSGIFLRGRRCDITDKEAACEICNEVTAIKDKAEDDLKVELEALIKICDDESNSEYADINKIIEKIDYINDKYSEQIKIFSK